MTEPTGGEGLAIRCVSLGNRANRTVPVNSRQACCHRYMQRGQMPRINRLAIDVEQVERVRINRRAFLRVFSHIAFAGVLSSCGASSPETPPAQSTPLLPTPTSSPPTATPQPPATNTPQIAKIVTPTATSPSMLYTSSESHVITDLCIRDGACAEVCPVECIIPGCPESGWPWYYVDPDTCINCGACVPECPVEAAMPGLDVPLESQRYVIEKNATFFSDGPGYAALDTCA